MKLERRLGLKEDENLLAVVRTAPITSLVSSLGIVALILAPFFFLVLLLRVGTFGYVLMGVSEFLGLALLLRGWVKWRGSMLAVTERRLIVVRQHGFFDRHVTELPFAGIQHASYRVVGMFSTVFRYGSILIELASGVAPIVMHRIARPERVQDLITELLARNAHARGDFGEALQAVSRMDARQLGLLKAEVERTERLLPPDRRA